MTDRMAKEDYDAFVRSIANRIKPGTVKGRRTDNLPVDEESHDAAVSP